MFYTLYHFLISDIVTGASWVTVPLDAPQLTLLFSQFFLVCKVIQIQDIQNLICISSRHGPEALSFSVANLGREGENVLLYF